MEYVPHGKLQSYLRNSRAQRYYDNMHAKSATLTSRDLTSFCYQVARGMEFLSGKGRDSLECKRDRKRRQRFGKWTTWRKMRINKRNHYRQPDSPDSNRKSKKDSVSKFQLT
ncbi:hypothetical protein J6590_055141 [Homalodisca vitripennis]|nr:hypothetical protein J6590_055141 [Homalodisca vitripennis]